MEEKKFWQSKTFYFGLLWVLVGVAGSFGYADFVPNEDWDQVGAIVNGLITILLRFLTSKGITL